MRAGTPRKAMPQMLTWDLSAALAQFGLRTQQPAERQPASGPAAADDAAAAAPRDSPRSPSTLPTTAREAVPADGASGSTLSRRPSLGSILRAVSLPCNMSGDDDPTVSPCSDMAIEVKAQVCHASRT